MTSVMIIVSGLGHSNVILFMCKILISFILHHHKDNSSNDKKHKHGHKNPNPAWHSTTTVIIITTRFLNTSTNFTSILHANSSHGGILCSILCLIDLCCFGLSGINLVLRTGIKCSSGILEVNCDVLASSKKSSVVGKNIVETKSTEESPALSALFGIHYLLQLATDFFGPFIFVSHS